MVSVGGGVGVHVRPLEVCVVVIIIIIIIIIDKSQIMKIYNYFLFIRDIDRGQGQVLKMVLNKGELITRSISLLQIIKR